MLFPFTRANSQNLTARSIVTLDPDGARHKYRDHEPAYKRIPRSNVPRSAETRVNSDFLDSVQRLLAARYWTERLRPQAEIACDVLTLLEEVPVRLLNVYDNTRRRREWVDRVPSPPMRQRRPSWPFDETRSASLM